MPDDVDPARAAFPVAVVIHGGFWRARYGRKLMRPLCHDLAERGWAAWNLEYRRLGHGSGGGVGTSSPAAASRDELFAHCGRGSFRTLRKVVSRK